MTSRSPTPAEASENRRLWLKKTKHDPLYNLEKTFKRIIEKKKRREQS